MGLTAIDVAMAICDEFEISADDPNFMGGKWYAYWDQLGGIWTIGRGITEYLDGRGIGPGDRLSSQEEAELYADQFEQRYLPGAKSMVPNWDQLPVEIQGALLSLGWNAGWGALGTSYPQTHRAILSGEPDQIGPAIMRINKAGGKPYWGLACRRYVEWQVMMSAPTTIDLAAKIKSWRYSEAAKIAARAVGINV